MNYKTESSFVIVIQVDMACETYLPDYIYPYLSIHLKGFPCEDHIEITTLCPDLIFMLDI